MGRAKRRRTCSRCQGKGHNMRTCKAVQALHPEYKMIETKHQGPSTIVQHLLPHNDSQKTMTSQFASTDKIMDYQQDIITPTDSLSWSFGSALTIQNDQNMANMSKNLGKNYKYKEKNKSESQQQSLNQRSSSGLSLHGSLSESISLVLSKERFKMPSLVDWLESREKLVGNRQMHPQLGHNAKNKPKIAPSRITLDELEKFRIRVNKKLGPARVKKSPQRHCYDASQSVFRVSSACGVKYMIRKQISEPEPTESIRAQFRKILNGTDQPVMSASQVLCNTEQNDLSASAAENSKITSWADSSRVSNINSNTVDMSTKPTLGGEMSQNTSANLGNFSHCTDPTFSPNLTQRTSLSDAISSNEEPQTVASLDQSDTLKQNVSIDSEENCNNTTMRPIISLSVDIDTATNKKRPCPQPNLNRARSRLTSKQKYSPAVPSEIRKAKLKQFLLNYDRTKKNSLDKGNLAKRAPGPRFGIQLDLQSRPADMENFAKKAKLIEILPETRVRSLPESDRKVSFTLPIVTESTTNLSSIINPLNINVPKPAEMGPQQEPQWTSTPAIPPRPYHKVSLTTAATESTANLSSTINPPNINDPKPTEMEPQWTSTPANLTSTINPPNVSVSKPTEMGSQPEPQWTSTPAVPPRPYCKQRTSTPAIPPRPYSKVSFTTSVTESTANLTSTINPPNVSVPKPTEMASQQGPQWTSTPAVPPRPYSKQRTSTPAVPTRPYSKVSFTTAATESTTINPSNINLPKPTEMGPQQEPQWTSTPAIPPRPYSKVSFTTAVTESTANLTSTINPPNVNVPKPTEMGSRQGPQWTSIPAIPPRLYNKVPITTAATESIANLSSTINSPNINDPKPMEMEPQWTSTPAIPPRPYSNVSFTTAVTESTANLTSTINPPNVNVPKPTEMGSQPEPQWTSLPAIPPRLYNKVSITTAATESAAYLTLTINPPYVSVPKPTEMGSQQEPQWTSTPAVPPRPCSKVSSTTAETESTANLPSTINPPNINVPKPTETGPKQEPQRTSTLADSQMLNVKLLVMSEREESLHSSVRSLSLQEVNMQCEIDNKTAVLTSIKTELEKMNERKQCVEALRKRHEKELEELRQERLMMLRGSIPAVHDTTLSQGNVFQDVTQTCRRRVHSTAFRGNACFPSNQPTEEMIFHQKQPSAGDCVPVTSPRPVMNSEMPTQNDMLVKSEQSSAVDDVACYPILHVESGKQTLNINLTCLNIKEEIIEDCGGSVPYLKPAAEECSSQGTIGIQTTQNANSTQTAVVDRIPAKYANRASTTNNASVEYGLSNDVSSI